MDSLCVGLLFALNNIFNENARMRIMIAAEPNVLVRSAAPQDDEFLLELYSGGRAKELAEMGWSEDQSAAFFQMQYDLRSRAYRMQFPAAKWLVIEADGRPAGQLIVEQRPDQYHLIDIALHPRQRNLGIGSAVLKWLLNDAAVHEKHVTLKVDKVNYQAKEFYERLGFLIAAETQLLYLMTWASTTSADPPSFTHT